MCRKQIFNYMFGIFQPPIILAVSE